MTGARGTVGKALAEHLRAGGHTVTAWDRQRAPITDYHSMESYVRDEAPDVLFHLAIASQPTGLENEGWLVNWQWPSELAWITRQLAVTFVYTSTVMVFTSRLQGPYTPETAPDETEGYGAEKLRAERRVFEQNPEARVARLGWQIGDAPGGNNMLTFLEDTQRREGVIRASRRWFPACSMVGDTAAGLVRVANLPPGLYLLDSNQDATFYEIARALARRQKTRAGVNWKVEFSDDFIYDQRMTDPRPGMRPLRESLRELAIEE